MQYKYNKAAGALNEAIQQQQPRPAASRTRSHSASSPFDDDGGSYVQAHNTGVFNIPAAPPTNPCPKRHHPRTPRDARSVTTRP